MATVICETDRLLLREFTLDDAEAFFELHRDPAVTRFTSDAGPATVDEARDILRTRPIADYQKYGYGRWACILKSNGQLIGMTGLKYLDDLREVDIGYRLLPAHWGRGLATEASRPAIRYGFGVLHLERIIGLVDPANVASVRVLEKLGLNFSEMVEYRGSPAAKYTTNIANDVGRPS